MGRSQNHIRRG